MPSLATTVSTSSFRPPGPSQRVDKSYAAVVRGKPTSKMVVDSDPAPCVQEQHVFSMAALNEGSVPIDNRLQLVPLDALAPPAPAFSLLAELNAGSEPVIPRKRTFGGPHGATVMQNPTRTRKAIGCEREPHAAAEAEETGRHPLFVTQGGETTYEQPMYELATHNAAQAPIQSPPLYLPSYVYHPWMPGGAFHPVKSLQTDDVSDGFHPYAVPHPAQHPHHLHSRSSDNHDSSFHQKDVARIDPRWPSTSGLTKPWKCIALLSSPDSPPADSGSPPHYSSPPVIRRHKFKSRPSRRKYYGPFEACSREDVLPSSEFAAEESSDEEADEGSGWSVLDMKRYTTAVKNRLLARYHTNPAPVELPTGILVRRLPDAVQVRPLYHPLMWEASLGMMERLSEREEEWL